MSDTEIRKPRKVRVVCLYAPGLLLETYLPPREGDWSDLAVIAVPDASAAERELGGDDDAVLLLSAYSKEFLAKAHELAKNTLRPVLPVFLALRSSEVTPAVRAEAEQLGIAILPLPMAGREFWETLRSAIPKRASGRFKSGADKRRFFRMPLQATAHLSVASRTVDISIGGVQMLSSHNFRAGDRGTLSVPGLEHLREGGLPFEVVQVDELEEGSEFPYRVRARFVDLDEATVKKLEGVLTILE